VSQFAQREQLREHRVAGGRTQCQGFQAPLLQPRPELHFCVLIPDLTLRLPYLPKKAIALRVAQTIRRWAVGGI
jgi:hypothetical protein